MDILTELLSDREISSHLYMFDRVEWPEHIKKLVLYSIRRVHSSASQVPNRRKEHVCTPSKPARQKNTVKESYKRMIYPEWWPYDNDTEYPEKQNSSVQCRAVSARTPRTDHSAQANKICSRKKKSILKNHTERPLNQTKQCQIKNQIPRRSPKAPNTSISTYQPHSEHKKVLFTTPKHVKNQKSCPGPIERLSSGSSLSSIHLDDHEKEIMQEHCKEIGDTFK